jgi:hypothetical protein
MGPAGVQELPRRAARHRHLPPGQPGISRPDRLDQGRRRRDRRLSGHLRRHRQPHHHDQRPGRSRLGRRRHRGRSRDARPADLHAAAGSHRLQADRQDEGRRHRHRPGADRRADAAQEGRCRQVRRILRPRPRFDDAGRPRDHRQHGSGIRRDLRLLPDRWRNAELPQHVRPRRRAHRAGRGLFQGAGHVPRTGSADPGVHRHAGTRPRHVVPSMAGPKRPEGRIPLETVAAASRSLRNEYKKNPAELDQPLRRSKARTTISAMATWPLPPSPPAPTPPTRAC